MKGWKDKVHFVLVEPSEPGNVGAAARAIKNMGFINLSLINPKCELNDEAGRFAHNAMDVLSGAKIYTGLTDALAEKSLVLGTSRLKGRKRGMSITIEVAAEKIISTANNNGKVAVLFGREHSGLTPAEIDECAYMINIPTDTSQPSINLAQAVMVVAYELGRGKRAISPPAPPAAGAKSALATHADEAVLFERMKHILELTGYTKRGDREVGRKLVLTIKNFLGRAGLTKDELDALSGVCRRIVKRLDKHGLP